MKEIQRIQTDRLRNEKLRQSIRENSVELRDLEQKLNYAYMNKERALQITEKQLLLKQEKVCRLALIAHYSRACFIQRNYFINIGKLRCIFSCYFENNFINHCLFFKELFIFLFSARA